MGGAHIDRLAKSAVKDMDETTDPQRFVTQQSSDFDINEPITADRVLVIHGKTWLPGTFERNPFKKSVETVAAKRRPEI